MANLIAESGSFRGLRYELDAPATVLGRHPHCEVVIDVGAVSRRHAQVDRIGDAYFIQDLGSRNGTYVNERQISDRRQLREGDTIRICDVVYTFHDKDPTSLLAAPPGGAGQEAGDGSSVAALLTDDSGDSGSTVMSRLDVSRSSGGVRVSSSPEVKLGALLEITQSLGKALSLDEVLPNVLGSLFKIFVQADRGLIVLKRPDGVLTPRWTKLRRESDDDTIRISRTVVNRVMESQEAILSADAESDARFDMSESLMDLRVRSIMCAPLVDSDGKAFGVLQIDTMDGRNRFQPDDLEVLVSVASQAAIAINNAQLHESALAQRELDRDLALARQVQHGFLPERPPRIPGYEFFNYYQPANFIGGDYYDYVALPDGRVAVIVADVVGHGVAAALLMAKFSADVRFCLASELHPATAVTALNHRFSQGNLEDRFVTFVMAVIHPETHEVTIVNAGHMGPLWRSSDGRVRVMAEEIAGLPLGIVADYEYEQLSTPLGVGESLALYTDGINEASNRGGELYTIDRIRSRVAAARNGASALGDSIIHDVREFVAGEPQGDDMCLVCVSRGGNLDDTSTDEAMVDLSEPSRDKAGATSIY
jgi:sigma-B regulation protein RsbU (phosphoserine phosphatase)